MIRNLALPMVAMLAFGLAAPANAQFGKPSKQQQVELGKKAADEIRSKEKVLPSYDERVRLLRSVAHKLLATVDDSKQPWEYSFDVIESKELNAFALPGGPVFFYTGLLDKLKTEDEVAGILSHELTHVRREHWAYQYRDEQQKGLLLNLGLILLKANREAASIANIGLDVLVNLPYSRKHESEADDKGFDMMVKAGYNPEGLAEVFRTLKASGGSKPPPFLSSHPADQSRINHIEDRIDKSGRKFPAETPLPWAK